MKDGLITLTLPLCLVSEANQREHWAKKAKRAKHHRVVGRAAMRPKALSVVSGWWFPMHVVMTRMGKRRLDSDNLAGACKGLRDGIADAFGIDDGDESKVTWEVRQEIAKEYSVRIEIRRRGEVAA